MSALSIFRYDGRDVYTLMVEGEPWFKVADVCAVLEIGNPSMAAARLDEDEVTLISIEGRPQTNFVNEAGLFSLILGSRKPEARAFKRWVTHEVLPAIRKTGAYSVEHALPQSYAEALRELAVTVEQNAALEARIAEDAPKVEAYDQLMDADGYYSMESTAKMCGLGRNNLYRRLREEGVIQPGSTLPYQKYMHHFVLTASAWTDGDGNVHPTQTTRVRPSGLPFILRKAGVA